MVGSNNKVYLFKTFIQWQARTRVMFHSRILARYVSSFVFLLVIFNFSSHAVTRDGSRNNATCGIEQGQPLTNAYGPWDFTNPTHAEKLPIVLRVHFTSDVERLISGATGGIEHDLDYTLRAIPNYHRALFTIARHQRANGTIPNIYTAECYFKRAIYFQPQDAVSRMLFGIHLHMIQDYSAALTQYTNALSISPSNIEIHYNMALTYIETGEFEKAREHAEIAYQGGYPLQGLKNKLKELGYYADISSP